MMTAKTASPQLIPSTAMPKHSPPTNRSEEHTSELQSQSNLVCRLLLEKKSKETITNGRVLSRLRAPRCPVLNASLAKYHGLHVDVCVCPSGAEAADVPVVKPSCSAIEL